MKRTPLARGSALERRTPLRARSDKRSATAQERREFVARILATRPWCEFPDCRARAVDVDEKVNRSQGSPIVPSQGLADSAVNALCRPHHIWKTDHPAEAVAMGLGQWGMR